MYVGDVDFFLCVVKTEKGKFVNLKFVCMYVCVRLLGVVYSVW